MKIIDILQGFYTYSTPNPIEQRIKYGIFGIPFGFLAISTILSLTHKEAFFTQVTRINTWILETFGDVFSWTSFLCVIMIIIIYFSPFGKIRIGGAEAKPLLSKWKLFSITLCTTIATGVLFWGTAEPLYHLHQGPENLQLAPGSAAAETFAMSTMYMHWTLTPYSIYSIMALLFALSYYNLGRPFSLGTLIYPLLGKRSQGWVGGSIDVICLFALVAGMAASLGSGVLSISGGFNKLFGWNGSVFMYGIIALAIVACFTLSAGSGLMKGIRILSDYNARAFFVISILVFILIAPWESLVIGFRGLLDYFQHFLQRSTNFVDPLEPAWSQSWTTFYWANWMAWAPVTSLFLGRIAYGYTVRQFVHFNLLLTSLFGAVWMMIFGGITLHLDRTLDNFPLYQSMQDIGPESVIYQIFAQLPFATILGSIISFCFLLLVFLSMVTASDSNTSAMSGMSSTGITPTNAEAPLYIKIAWGLIIGIVAWVMISYAGIDGIKMISTIGGLPALFLFIAILIAWIKLLIQGGLESTKE